MSQSIFSLVIYQPVLNFIVFLAHICNNNLGLAVVIFTVLFRLLLWPLFEKSEKVQKQLSTIQPELQKIQKQYKGDQEGMTKAMMDLYKDHNMNPTATFSVLAFSLFQIAAMFVFYSLFGNLVNPAGASSIASLLYPANTGFSLNLNFLGLNLGSHSFLLAAIYTVIQVVQMQLLLKKQKAQAASNPMASQMSKVMMYTLPLVILSLYKSIYAILYLYWTMFSLVSIIQDWLASRK